VLLYFSLHLTLTGTGVAAIVRSLRTIRRLIKTIIRLIRMMVAVPTRANIVISVFSRKHQRLPVGRRWSLLHVYVETYPTGFSSLSQE